MQSLLLHKIALFHLLPSLKFSTFCIYFQTLQPWNDFLLSLSIINYTVNICITFSLSYKLHHFLLHIEEPGNFSSNLCRHSSLKVSKWRCTCATLIVQNSTGLGNKATVGNTSRRQLPFKLSFRKKPRSYFCIDLDSVNTQHLFAKWLLKLNYHNSLSVLGLYLVAPKLPLAQFKGPSNTGALLVSLKLPILHIFLFTQLNKRRWLYQPWPSSIFASDKTIL